MMIKLLGVALTVIGCGSVGFQIAANYRREEKSLQQLSLILEYMECELQYRLTSLPELCRQVGRMFKQAPANVFVALTSEMESQISPDVSCCMTAVLSRTSNITPITRKMLENLGMSIGKFDINGQIQGFSSINEECKRNIKALKDGRDNRLRSYQTLGLCAGAALAILLV